MWLLHNIPVLVEYEIIFWADGDGFGLHTLNRRFSPPTGFKILDRVDKLNFCCSVFSPAALERDVH